jgi:hypothetical protein
METHLLVYSMVDIYRENMKGWRIGDRMPPSAFATLENITYLCSFLDQSPPVKLRGLGQKEMERIIKDFDIRVRDATPGCQKTPYR